MNSVMIDMQTAKQIAIKFLGEPASTADFSFVILDEYTIEKPKCFVFFYESSRFLETDRFEDRLVGNAPILIDRRSGTSQFLGTAEPVENYIERFEAAQ
jgi:hypothetical protein